MMAAGLAIRIFLSVGSIRVSIGYLSGSEVIAGSILFCGIDEIEDEDRESGSVKECLCDSLKYANSSRPAHNLITEYFRLSSVKAQNRAARAENDLAKAGRNLFYY